MIWLPKSLRDKKKSATLPPQEPRHHGIDLSPPSPGPPDHELRGKGLVYDPNHKFVCFDPKVHARQDGRSNWDELKARRAAKAQQKEMDERASKAGTSAAAAILHPSPTREEAKARAALRQEREDYHAARANHNRNCSPVCLAKQKEYHSVKNRPAVYDPKDWESPRPPTAPSPWASSSRAPRPPTPPSPCASSSRARRR